MFLALLATGLAVQVDFESLVGQLDAPSWRAREVATMAIAKAQLETADECVGATSGRWVVDA